MREELKQFVACLDDYGEPINARVLWRHRRIWWEGFMIGAFAMSVPAITIAIILATRL